MNTSVSSACAQNLYRLLGELCQRRFEFVLNGFSGELTLPALVALAVVAQAQGDAHGSRLSRLTTVWLVLEDLGLPDRPLLVPRRGWCAFVLVSIALQPNQV